MAEENKQRLRTIIEEIGKINSNERLEIEKLKDMTRKALEEFRIEKTEEVERKLRFLTLTNRSFRIPSNYNEKKRSNKHNKKAYERDRWI